MQKRSFVVSITDVLIFILIVAEYRFFFIPLPLSIAKANTYHNKTIEIILVALLIIFIAKYKLSNFKFKNQVLLLLLLILINGVYTYFRYPGENSKSIIIPTMTYLLLLLYFPLNQYFKGEGKFYRFLDIFQWCNILACTVTIAQSIIYSINHRIYLQIYEYIVSPTTIASISRSAFLRITYISTPVSIALLFSIIDILIYKRRTKLNWISTFLGVVHLAVSSQTRMYIAIFVLLFIYTFYFLEQEHKKRSKWLKYFLVTLLVIVIAWAVDLPGIIKNIIAPIIDGSYATNGSYFARFDAITYFTKSILQHPIFGLGIIRVEKGSSYYNIIRGITGYANYTDVGIIGSLAEFGFPIIIVFVSMLIKMKKQCNYGGMSFVYYQKIILWFIILSCISLSVLDPQRIIILPIALAVFEQHDLIVTN